MLNSFKTVLATAIVGVAATTAWAVVAPIVVVNAPDQVKVGEKFNVSVVAINPDPSPPGTPEPELAVLTLAVKVQFIPKAGTGNGRKTDVLVDVSNHEMIELEIPLQAPGWALGALVTAESTTMDPVTMEMAGSSTSTMIPFTRGNGSPK